MCYGSPTTHYVCLSCRVAVKNSPRPQREHPCRRCGHPMTDAGSNLAVPRRGDRDAWEALATVLRSGLTFHSCGCSGPGYRPRTRAEARDRIAVSRRQDVPVRDALVRPDPWRDPGC